MPTTEQQAERQWFKMKEAAAYIELPYSTFTQLAAQGHIPVSLVPGTKQTYRVHREELDNYLRKNVRKIGEE